MILALTIIHVVISLALILVVLMQHGKQQGLSGAIAGGAETFFGKNKGRTIDAILKKFTAVIAILFVISSLALAAISINTYNKENADAAAEITANGETAADTAALSLDENGNLVDDSGNVVATAEEIAEQQAAAEENAASNEGGTEEGSEVEAQPAE